MPLDELSARWQHPALVGLLLLGFFIVACRPEDKLIFHPSAEIVQIPTHVGLEFEDLFFTTTDDVRLHGWFIPHRDASATMVWFHGNAGNISHRIDNIKRLHDKIKINIFIFDYRGYGRSAGWPSEQGTYEDGAAALALLVKQRLINAKALVLFGRSLGAAVAAEMAGRFECRGLILESPFMSIREMARTVIPVLPLGHLVRTRYDVMEKIRKVKVPLLVLHGDRDDVVPYEQGRKVFAAANHPKEFYSIAGADHNNTYLVGGEAYFQRLRSFVQMLFITAPVGKTDPGAR